LSPHAKASGSILLWLRRPSRVAFPARSKGDGDKMGESDHQGMNRFMKAMGRPMLRFMSAMSPCMFAVVKVMD